MKKLALSFLLLSAASFMAGQTAINPNTQIKWSQSVGSGAPVATCNSSSYGTPYTDVSANVPYVCTTAGWVQSAVLASYGLNIKSLSLSEELPNNTSSGATLNKLVCTNSSAQAQTCTTASVMWSGVAVGGATGLAAGNTILARTGQASCVFDGTTVIGDYVQISSTVAGDCHDTGSGVYPTNGAVVGRVVTINGGAGTAATVNLYSPGIVSNTGSGTVTASPQFSLFYQPNSGSSSTAQGDANVTTDGNGNLVTKTLITNVPNTLNVKQYGAKGNGQTAAMTTSTSAGLTTVTCASCAFTASDVGKVINILGAGASYLGGGTLGTPNISVNASGVVQPITFTGPSGLPTNATIPVTFTGPGAGSAGVTASGYVTTDGSGVPTMNLWVAGMDYATAPTISVGNKYLQTTIASVVDATHITTTIAATNDVTGATVYYGTDDTVAINSAIQAMLSSSIANPNGGAQLNFPSGMYIVTGRLAVNSGTGTIPTGWKMVGSSYGNTRIIQMTDNTPIFDFTQQGQWGFVIEDFAFVYANYQTPNFTSSNSIYFDMPNGVGGTWFHFVLRRLMFYSGYRGVNIAPHSSGAQPIWGFRMEDINGGGSMSGATLYLSSTPTAGQPRCQINNISGGQSIGEPIITIGAACGEISATNLEVDNGYGQVLAFSGSHLHFSGFHCELCHLAVSNGIQVDITNVDAKIDSITDHLILPDIGGAGSFHIFNANGYQSGTGAAQIFGIGTTIDPCYTVGGGCSPPAHNVAVIRDSQAYPAEIGQPVWVSGSNFTPGVLAAVEGVSDALNIGSVIRQNQATGDGQYIVPVASSPYQANPAQAVYQRFPVVTNYGGANSGFGTGWTGAHVKVRGVQPSAGSGPFTWGPNGVTAITQLTQSNGSDGGTGATATATYSGGRVATVTCSGGTGYVPNKRYALQFANTPGTNVIPATGYCQADSSGNLNSAGALTYTGLNYSSAPSVTVGEAWTMQEFFWDNDLARWVGAGPAVNSDSSMCFPGISGGMACFSDPSNQNGITFYLSTTVGRTFALWPSGTSCPQLNLGGNSTITYQGGQTNSTYAWVDCNGSYYGNHVSQSTNPATTGQARFAVGDSACWRNNANSANKCLAEDGSDRPTWAGTELALSTDLSPYALLASPVFTGTPAAPTATLGTNTTQLATTAFVQNAINNVTSPVVAHGDATGQTANVSVSTLYAVPAGGQGTYRVSCYTVVTTAAATSSTLPNCIITYTDPDSSQAHNLVGITQTSAGNTVGTTGNGSGTFMGQLTFQAKASTNISWAAQNYASNPASTMAYAVHIKLEYLGQ